MENPFIQSLLEAGKWIAIALAVSFPVGVFVGHAFAFMSGTKDRWFEIADDGFEQDQ